MKAINKLAAACAKMIVEDAHRPLYHFVSPRQLYYILKNRSITTSKTEYGKDGRYVSFSRTRNGVQGYPFMQHGYTYGGGTDHNSGSPFYIVRIELSGTMLAANHKVKPFDFMHVDLPSGNSGRSDALHPEYGYQYSKDELEQYQKNQPFAQAEDRLMTDKQSIEVIDKDGARRLIERVDVFVDNEQIKQANEWMKKNPGNDDFYDDIKKDKRILTKCIGLCRRYGIPFNQYDSMDRFNLQTPIKESVESSVPSYLDGTN